jgi:fibronectin-binding autotransporter adhesin
MSFFSWLRNRTSPRSLRWDGFQISPTAPRFRPQLEALEDRWMPSTLTVTDPTDYQRVGTLRNEIAVARSGDTIVFSPSLSGQAIALDSNYGELVINKNLTIQGLGAAHLTISGGSLTREFLIYSAQVTLAGLTISRGNADAGYNAGHAYDYYPYYGGAIFNIGRLTLSNCNVSGNVAFYGGGICDGGTMTLSGCTVSNNEALYGGLPQSGNGGDIYNDARTSAGTYGNLTITSSTVTGNIAQTEGGGIYNKGSLDVTYSTVTGNSSYDVYNLGMFHKYHSTIGSVHNG